MKICECCGCDNPTDDIICPYCIDELQAEDERFDKLRRENNDFVFCET